MKLLREDSGENAGEKDIEEIEERTDTRDERRVAVNRRRRQAVQPGRY